MINPTWLKITQKGSYHFTDPHLEYFLLSDCPLLSRQHHWRHQIFRLATLFASSPSFCYFPCLKPEDCMGFVLHGIIIKMACLLHSSSLALCLQLVVLPSRRLPWAQGEVYHWSGTIPWFPWLGGYQPPRMWIISPLSSNYHISCSLPSHLLWNPVVSNWLTNS